LFCLFFVFSFAVNQTAKFIYRSRAGEAIGCNPAVWSKERFNRSPTLGFLMVVTVP
jgi:hypothetical protein